MVYAVAREECFAEALPPLFYYFGVRMKKSSGKLLNVLLAAGMLAVFVAFLFFIGFSDGAAFFFRAAPVAAVLCGLIFLFIFICVSQTRFKLFMALSLISCGMYAAFMVGRLLPVPMGKGWPLFPALIGISLFIAGRTQRNRSFFACDFPSALLVAAGIVFSLFSFGLIRIPFGKVAAVAGPVIALVACAILSVIVIKRKALLGILPKDISDELKRGDDADGEDL